MKIEVSNGEIIDKITILQIKMQNIVDKNKLINIQKELDLLLPYLYYIEHNDIKSLFVELKICNSVLWDLENEIRQLDSDKNYDELFIIISKNIIKYNDIRSKLKQKINLVTNSILFEEKSY